MTSKSKIDYKITEEDFENLLKLKQKLLSDCKRCDGEGILEVDSSEKSGWIGSRECKCMKKFHKLKEYYKARIPSTYWRVTEKNFYGDKKALKVVQKFMDNLENGIENGLGMLLWGTNGNGKTSLAIIALKYAITEGHTGYYITLQGLLNLIMHSFSDEKQKEDIRKIFTDVDFLVLDEIGKEHIKKNSSGSVFGISEIEEIIRIREGKKKSTWMLSNFKPQQIEARYGLSLASLMSGVMKTIEVIGVDVRRTIKQSSWEQILRKGK